MARRPRALCVVCQERPGGAVVCDTCGRSLADYRSDDGSVGAVAVIRWAAKRARRFERRRWRRWAGLNKTKQKLGRVGVEIDNDPSIIEDD